MSGEDEKTRALTLTSPAPLAPNLGAAELERIESALSAKHAGRTKNEYRRAWDIFDQWCRNRQLTSLPAHPQTIAAFLTDAAPSVSVSRLSVYVAAIGEKHTATWPQQSPPTKAPLIAATVKGIKRQYGKPRVKKRPVIAREMLEAVKKMPADGFVNRRNRVLVVLGFASGMRRSELINIRVSDIEEQELGWRIFLPKSKTDQEGQGRWVPIGYNDAFPELCPIRALKAWREYAKPVDYVFTHANGAKFTRADVVSSVVKKAALAANPKADPAKYGGHSLRRGHATQARLDGRRGELVQRQLGHKKYDTTLGYFEDVDPQLDNSSINLGKRLSKDED